MFYGHAASLLSLKKQVVIEVSRPTFYNAKIMLNNQWKSQIAKKYGLKNVFLWPKMHFSYKNITFMHENLSHFIKWILCVHNPSEYLLKKHFNRWNTVLYVNVSEILSSYSGGQRVH